MTNGVCYLGTRPLIDYLTSYRLNWLGLLEGNGTPLPVQIFAATGPGAKKPLQNCIFPDNSWYNDRSEADAPGLSENQQAALRLY